MNNNNAIRKTVQRKLATRQEISITPQEERLLRRAFEFMAAYTIRVNMEQAIDQQKKRVEELQQSLPPGSKLTMPVKDNSDSVAKSFRMDLRTELEIKMDEFYSAKENLHRLDKQLKDHLSVEHVITARDIDNIGKKFNCQFSKKFIEQMIWEVDEKLDGVICYDEFTLTYVRNVLDTSGSEPSSFFHLMDFLIFDETKKGYIIEDDCMEILFARYGSSKLEKEMLSIFGNKLRAQGGDGTLDLSGFFQSMEVKLGRRAPLN